MKTACLIILLCAWTAFCFPSKPLNERSTEVAWQAWLLVDPSNRQVDNGGLRRRITPKSVFIAQSFSNPDSLPACAEGYQSDAMGRCVSIYKINEANHLNFLLGKLTKQFPHYEEESDKTPTTGPFLFNIPLNGESSENRFDNATNVAIVVAPTTTILPDNIDVKRKGVEFNTEDIAAIFGVDPEDIESTTIKELTTTQTESSSFTTVTESGETTTLETTTSETTESSTTTESETTTVIGDALFFQFRI